MKLSEPTKDDKSSGDDRARNSGYSKFSIDEFEDHDDYTKTYIRYRIAGGRMKFNESDTGSEEHYARFPGIEFDEIGDWNQDYNNIAPCEWSMRNSEYIKWFVANHPQPVDIRQATRFWLDRREMLWRRQHPTPDSYEEFLQSSEFGPGEKYAGGYGYTAHPEDTWDQGELYKMHLIRLQAAINLQPLMDHGAYIMEQDINNYLIAHHKPEEEEEEATLTAQQKRDATLEKVRGVKDTQRFFVERARTKNWPKPAPVRPPPEKHDWDFLYRSLQALLGT